VPGRVELRGFEPLPSCMPSQRTLQIGHHCTMPDLTRPQVRNAAPCGLVRRHAASCREIDGERPSSHPCHTCATTTEPYSQPGSSLAGRSNPPGATPACAPTETQRARREVEWVSVRDYYDDPHRRSLTGGAHSSSRLAAMRFTQSSRCRTFQLVSACIQGRSDRHSGSSAQSRKTSQRLPHVRRHPIDG
jgi:hypothetical protein